MYFGWFERAGFGWYWRAGPTSSSALTLLPGESVKMVDMSFAGIVSSWVSFTPAGLVHSQEAG